MSDDWIRYRELVLQTVKDLRSDISSLSKELKEARFEMEKYFRGQDVTAQKVKHLEQQLTTAQDTVNALSKALEKLDDSVDTIKLEAVAQHGDSKLKNKELTLKVTLVLFILAIILTEGLRWLVKHFGT